jgi:phosphoglycolate phosphatase
MTLTGLEAVFFDVDGVLLDSLPQHLRFCQDKAHQYGLNLSMPSADMLKRKIAEGISVSPMVNFFRAVGFPDMLAQRGTHDYEREFMPDYRPAGFPGVEEAIRALHAARLPLGLVTSNTRANVEPALAHLMQYFDSRCLFYFDAHEPARDKVACLREGARRLGIAASRCCYIGDQPADAAAAQAAGYRFLGVSYGWGFQPDERDVHVVDSISAIPEAIARMQSE